MRQMMDRLQSGERWWAAEILFRFLALALFWLAALCGRGLEHRVTLPPPHQASPAEFAIAAAGVVLGAGGLACLIEGPGLLRIVPLPRRRLF